MDHNLEAITAEVAEAVWNANKAPGQGEFTEQAAIVQFTAKERLLPTISLIVPIVDKEVERAQAQKMIDIINIGHELKHSPEEILLALTFELSGVSL